MSTKSEMVAEIADNLRRIFQSINDHSKNALRQTGLTGPQLWAIKVVAESGPVKQSEIARRMYLHPATIGSILDNLERKGLVVRTRSSTDRRVVTTELTPEGTQVVENTPTIAQGLLVEGLEKLSGEELHNITAGLRDVVRIIGAQDIPPRLILSPEVNRPATKKEQAKE